MQKLYSTFPGGRLGIGLLILRTAAGVATSVYGAILVSRLEAAAGSQFSYVSQLILGLLLITGSIFFLLGLMMPFVSIMVAISELAAAVMRLVPGNPMQESEFGWVALLLLASITIALSFLGPGAYSIDARLFGRRRIFIPSSPKSEEK